MSKNRDPWPSNAKLLKRLCDYAGKLRIRLGDYGFGPMNAISQIGKVIHKLSTLCVIVYTLPRGCVIVYTFGKVIHKLSTLCVIVYTPGCPKMGICVIIYTLWMLRRKSVKSAAYSSSHMVFNKKAVYGI